MAQQNPFGTGGAGANAFKAAYDRLKAEADAARQGIGENYASAYQQLRQQGYGAGLGAAAQRGLSGGQAAGVRGAISAQQMGQLGQLMQGQERALREQKAGEASIYSNALLEGQQAQQYERENQEFNYGRVERLQSIVNDTKLTDAEKQQRLETLGYSPEQITTFLQQGKPGTNVDWWRYGAYLLPSNWGKSPETLQWEAEQKRKNPMVTQQQLDANNPYRNR
jgi:hypothetical protein